MVSSASPSPATSAVAACQCCIRRGRCPPPTSSSAKALTAAGSTRRTNARSTSREWLGKACVTYVRSHEQSQALSERTEPCVVVASGGMCASGCILNHLRRHVDDPRCSLVLVSYQAPNTLGARLLERGPTVQFHGRTWNKWFDVVRLDGFSGHADREDFRALLGPALARTGK